MPASRSKSLLLANGSLAEPCYRRYNDDASRGGADSLARKVMACIRPSFAGKPASPVMVLLERTKKRIRAFFVGRSDWDCLIRKSEDGAFYNFPVLL
jgi:hypothetical protein